MKEYVMRYENEVLQLLPDKMQELVRCKDCRHLSSPVNGVPFCEHIKKFVGADWFCADGERKE